MAFDLCNFDVSKIYTLKRLYNMNGLHTVESSQSFLTVAPVSESVVTARGYLVIHYGKVVVKVLLSGLCLIIRTF